MKRTPIVDNNVYIHIEHGTLVGRDLIVCDRPPDPSLVALATGSIAIRRRGGYTTHLGVGSGHTRAWYALASEYVLAASYYLRRNHPDLYHTIEWWGS